MRGSQRITLMLFGPRAGSGFEQEPTLRDRDCCDRLLQRVWEKNSASDVQFFSYFHCALGDALCFDGPLRHRLV